MKTMKIAIDASQIIYGTGVSVYTRQLIDNLLLVDKKNFYVLFGGSLRRRKELTNILESLGKFSVNCKVGVFPSPPLISDVLWNKLHILPIEKIIGKVDVFHSSDWTQPPSKAFKVTTIHDLVPIKYPKLSHPKIISVTKNRLKWVKSEVDRIIVPSQTTKKDLVELGYDETKLRVIAEACDPAFLPQPEDKIEAIKKLCKIEGGYLLAVGVNDRKNTKRIIEAFYLIKQDIKTKLVFIGHVFGDFRASDDVLFMDHVPQNYLPALYSGARVLVFPSLYEGFGLPILEAYASGTPVVTSNIGSMEEIGQGASVLVDPLNVKSIADGIMKAIENSNYYISRGKMKVKDYSWQKTAKETLKVYNEAC